MFHLRVTICYSMIKYRCQIYINIYTFSLHRRFSSSSSSFAFLLIYEGQMIPTRNNDDDEPDVIGMSNVIFSRCVFKGERSAEGFSAV